MPDVLLFDRLLRQAATILRTYYPGEDRRLDRGLELALNGRIQFGTVNGIAYADVSSSSQAEVFYVVRGTHCDCPDLTAPGLRCKHRYAVALTRMAQALTDMQDHHEESA